MYTDPDLNPLIVETKLKTLALGIAEDFVFVTEVDLPGYGHVNVVAAINPTHPRGYVPMAIIIEPEMANEISPVTSQALAGATAAIEKLIGRPLSDAVSKTLVA